MFNTNSDDDSDEEELFSAAYDLFGAIYSFGLRQESSYHIQG